MSGERLRAELRAATSDALRRRRGDRPLISVEQAAHLIGISRSVAYRWTRLGCLPGAVSVGGRWYVRRLVLLAWLAADDAGAPLPLNEELSEARIELAARGPASRGGA